MTIADVFLQCVGSNILCTNIPLHLKDIAVLPCEVSGAIANNSVHWSMGVNHGGGERVPEFGVGAHAHCPPDFVMF